MLTPDQFREQIEAFLQASNMTATRLGIEAVRDPNFVHDVRKGRVPSLAVAGQVIRFMEAKRVDGTSTEGAAA